ncbi:MAG: GYF domain-containing protein [Deltaproteobacteria bacterium]
MSHDETLRKTDWASADSSRTVGEGAAWAWATRQGAAEWASTEQLVFWLGRGDLPPQMLVWKPGWREWLPALQIAELAAAFPRVEPAGRSVAHARNPSAAAAPASARTLSPHVLELALPALLAAAPTPEQPSKHDGSWLLGTLFVGALAVLSLGSSWAAFSLAMTGLQPVEPPSLEDPSRAQPTATGSALPALSPAQEPAAGAPADAEHTANLVQLPPTHNPTVLRVSHLPKPRTRALPPSSRKPARSRARSRR